MAFILFLFSCSEQTHFISDPSYRNLVEMNFLKQKGFAKERSPQLFNVFKKDLTLEEEEALKFLYAFMPTCDLADYDGEYFLSMVKSSLHARAEMPWGKTIPEDVFRHFVLPYRINNENLDTARLVFYQTLKNRVADLSMKEAILEVNHWCHEHVAYKGADIRTSAPLATMRTGTGRCGEESTFTVAALRSVGIPARQVYTPRWAHCDDNHAWVEAWANGEWYFLGGCEPSPRLNQGWFASPAQRAMLVHTKAFGAYTGPEEIIHQEQQYSELNVLERYAETKKIHVIVFDEKALPVVNAKVDFGLYNYAEFFPIASLYTDDMGISSFTTGLGDLLIWASKEGSFSFEKITVSETDTLTLTLTKNQEFPDNLELNLWPPPLKSTVDVASGGEEECNLRLQQEDSIRQAYLQTFISKDNAFELALELNLDTSKVWLYLEKSCGNWKEIVRYLKKGKDDPFVLTLLENIADKDLRDTPSEILLDHLRSFSTKESQINNDELINNYVLFPRIKNEIIVPWRSFLRQNFDESFQVTCQKNISTLVNWINTNISINDEKQYYDLPITPKGVFELKQANKESRNIFFVAACRSFGIPSRLDPPTHRPQVWESNSWKDIFFGDETPMQKSASITFTLEHNNGFDPEYYIHFTLASIEQEGIKSLEFGYNQKWNEFPDPVTLYPGKYRLTTGYRLENSEILSTISIFELENNEHQEITIPLRTQVLTIKTIAEFEINGIVEISSGKEVVFPKNDAFVVIYINLDTEPTNHIFADMKKRQVDFNGLNNPFYFILQENQISKSAFKKEELNIPSKSKFCVDGLGTLKKLNGLFPDFRLDNNLPVTLIYKGNGEFVFFSSGYQIGLPDKLLKYLKNLG